MSVKHVLLMILHESPASVYQLKTAFEEATDNIWPMNIGQVYQTMQRLERDEYIAVVGEVNGNRPAPAYGITEKGHAELNRWISEPIQRPLDARDDLVMRITVLANIERGTKAQQSQRVVTDSQKKSLPHAMVGAAESAAPESVETPTSGISEGTSAAQAFPSVTALIHEQRMATIAQLRETTRKLSDIPTDNVTAQLLAERQIFELEAEGRWLDHIETLIQARNR